VIFPSSYRFPPSPGEQNRICSSVILFDDRIPARQSLAQLSLPLRVIPPPLRASLSAHPASAEVVDFVANPPTECTKMGTGAGEWNGGECEAWEG